MNRPTVHFSDDSLRKVGDSNPRYGKPARQFSKLVVSATHPTFQSDIVAKSTSIVLKCGCKDTTFFLFHQIFLQLFSRKVYFFLFFLLFGEIMVSKLLLSTKKEADLPIIGNLPPVGKGRSMMWWNSECHKHLRALRFCNPPALQLSWHVSLCGPP